MTTCYPAQLTSTMKNRSMHGFALAVYCGIAFGGTSMVRAEGGEQLFGKHCASCHGKDGKARTPIARQLGVKDLTQSKTTDGEIEKQVTEGKKDDRGNQKMPPFKDKLSPEGIKSLIEFVKGFRK
jgi:mono/diheme cytochrome c family protein